MLDSDTGGGVGLAEAPFEAPPEGCQDDASTSHRTILLLDGVRLFLKLEETLLARKDHRILTARTGLEALEILGTERVDLLVMDYVLPDVSGDEIVAAVRADPRNADTAILIVTARGMREHVDRAMRAGCNSFLYKPVHATELQARVRELLDVPSRRHLRTLVRLQVAAETSQRFFFGTTVNLSESGVLLETDLDVSLGEEVDLHFFLPGDEAPVTVRSRVVREAAASTSGRNAFGILFQGLDDHERTRINEFVTGQKAAMSV